MNLLRELFVPLQEASNEDWVLWGSACVLPALLAYPGGPATYMQYFASVPMSLDQLRWQAYLYHHLAALLLFFLIPALLYRSVLGKNLSDVGLTLGDRSAGLRLACLGFVFLPFACATTQWDSAFLREYPLTRLATTSPSNFMLWALCLAPYFFAWEFFFRGFLGLGLAKRVGVIPALFAQTSISVIIHIGKPVGETLAAIPGGILLGLLALRTRSIVWPFLCHYWVGILVHLFCGLA